MIAKSMPDTGRRKKQKGANILESALVLLTIMGSVLFIMDMGRILLIQQFITERGSGRPRETRGGQQLTDRPAAEIFGLQFHHRAWRQRGIWDCKPPT